MRRSLAVMVAEPMPTPVPALEFDALLMTATAVARNSNCRMVRSCLRVIGKFPRCRELLGGFPSIVVSDGVTVMDCRVARLPE